MTRLPSRPKLEWKDDGTPVATEFDDVYFSRSDGLEETRAVFFKACGIPERWGDKKNFTIAELGFGTGLNFLALADLWCGSDKPSDAWLDFLTVEKHPMAPADARTALARWPELAEFAEVLLENWPEQTAGLQRIVFPQWRISLTIYIGDALDWLKGIDFQADAWFLDGFAPSKNETMWSEDILVALGAHAKPGCLVGTYTVAGHVRRGLSAAGLEVSKQPGFGRKRERLEAIYPKDVAKSDQPDLFLSRPPVRPIDNVVVIGGGIAGASVARQFAEAGFRTQIYDRSETFGAGASGNPFGLVMPRLDAADTPQARFLIQSYLYALRFYERYAGKAMDRVSVCQSAQSDTEIKRFEKLLADPPLNCDWLEQDAGSEGLALLHHKAAILQPKRVLELLTDHPLIQMRLNADVSDIRQIYERSSKTTLIVAASGHALPKLLPDYAEWISGKQGQVELSDFRGKADIASVASGTYAIRHESKILFGATFEPFEGYGPASVSSTARDENIGAFQSLAPEWAGETDLTETISRASVRATTPDRFPIAGSIFEMEPTMRALGPLRHGVNPDEGAKPVDRMYVMTGLGARGFTFAPLLADLIVSQVLGRPIPLARSEQEMISPVRFLARAIRKGQLSV